MHNTIADVIVAGLGAMGSAAAFHLAVRGQRVIGFDRYQALHQRGSSHGGSRIIRQAYHEHPSYVPLVQRAYELWRDLETESGESLLQLTGGLMIGAPSSAIVQGTLTSARTHGLPHEVLEARDLQRRYPVFEPRPDDVAVYERQAGFLRPERAVHAHLASAARRGADLHFEEPVREWSVSSSSGRVRVQTSRESYEAGRLILAPGAWAPDLLRALHVAFKVRRHVACWFKPLGEVDYFSAQRCPIYIWDVNGSDVFYGFPATGSSLEGVKAAMHSGGDCTTAETADRIVRDRDVAELRGHLARFLPRLNGSLLHASVCLYTLTPDEHFVIDTHPRSSAVLVAGGFSGHGFKFSSVVGEILADLVTEGRTQHDIGLFAAKRFADQGVSEAV